MGMGEELYDDWLCENAGRESMVDQELWQTNDGRILKIRDMDTGHITNTVRMLKRKSEALDEMTFGNLRETYIDLFEVEMERRNGAT